MCAGVRVKLYLQPKERKVANDEYYGCCRAGCDSTGRELAMMITIITIDESIQMDGLWN